jgi:hypothetical protein
MVGSLSRAAPNRQSAWGKLRAILGQPADLPVQLLKTLQLVMNLKLFVLVALLRRWDGRVEVRSSCGA